jgi:hypothetical protein
LRLWSVAALIVSAASSSIVPAEKEKAAKDKAPEKVVIPFPFVSKFDGGRYGKMVADSIWKKLSRQGGFVARRRARPAGHQRHEDRARYAARRG